MVTVHMKSSPTPAADMSTSPDYDTTSTEFYGRGNTMGMICFSTTSSNVLCPSNAYYVDSTMMSKYCRSYVNDSNLKDTSLTSKYIPTVQLVQGKRHACDAFLTSIFNGRMPRPGQNFTA
ncbi:hypothetical protein Trydic_g12896 [Trypoxylus dichotomus]